MKITFFIQSIIKDEKAQDNKRRKERVVHYHEWKLVYQSVTDAIIRNSLKTIGCQLNRRNN